MVVNILYLTVWALLAAYCIYSARKYGAILYLLGGFFVFMFGWRLADTLISDISLFDGIYDIIFRVVAAVFLVIVLVCYFMLKKSR